MSSISLETERMVLCHFTTQDVDLLFELDSDPDVMRYLTGGASTPRDIIQNNILPTFLRSYEQGYGFGVWAAQEKTTGDFLGWFGFRRKDENNATLGYRLRKAAWGQGYATEGSLALIDRGFTQLGVQRVFATTYQDNLASRRVMEKVGMRLVRTYRYTKEDLAEQETFSPSGEPWDGDDVEYMIEKDEWQREP